jgi:DNA-binding response OmpR family regulator
VADDNWDGADSVAAFLRLDGHEVEVVNDGESALRQARANRPSVMVLDIGMPGMNGYEVAKAIRGEVWGSDIRLVAVTGWGQESDRALAFEAGFDQHLTKPFDPEKLLAFISS